MQSPRNDLWSCYPNGLLPSRRRFMRALAAAGTVAGLPGSMVACSQEPQEQNRQEEDESVPAYPQGGFSPGSIRLGFNENPLGPSPEALRAILDSGLKEGHRYNYIDPLMEAIADHHNLPAANVIVGCGSTEFLQFTPWALLKSGTSLVLPTPSYGYMAGVAENIGADVIRVPLGSQGRVDVTAMGQAIRSDTRLVYLANPNNPTGASLGLEEVRSLAKVVPREAVLFVDEAYHDFLPTGSAIELVRAGLPVVVARTFSKGYGMAGLRLGYAMAPEAVMEKLKSNWWGDFGINAAAHIAGPAAIADQEHLQRYVKTIDQGLSQLRGGLEQMGFKSLPHRAPFFVVDLEQRAKPAMLALYRRKIYVQDGGNWKMPSFLRISVGLPEQNEVFLEAMRELTSQPEFLAKS